MFEGYPEPADRSSPQTAGREPRRVESLREGLREVVSPLEVLPAP